MRPVVTKELVELFVKTWNRDNESWIKLNKALINYGWCYQFALLLKKLHGGELWYDHGHAWVKIDGKFYDSDHMDGVEDVKGIATYYGQHEIFSNVREEEFVRVWRHGGSGEVQLRLIDEVIGVYNLGNIGA